MEMILDKAAYLDANFTNQKTLIRVLFNTKK